MESLVIFALVSVATFFVVRHVYRQVTVGENNDNCDTCPVQELLNAKQQ